MFPDQTVFVIIHLFHMLKQLRLLLAWLLAIHEQSHKVLIGVIGQSEAVFQTCQPPNESN